MVRTLSDDIDTDVSRVFLDVRHFASSVTRYPLGIIANAVTVTVLWTPTSANEDMKRGRTNERSGTLQLADSVVVDSRDLWLIDSEMWSAGQWKTLPGGMKEATLKKPDKEFTTTHSSGGKW